MSKYDNIIFDLDGTIIDSSEGIYNALNKALLTAGLTICGNHVFQKLIGPPIRDIIYNLYPELEENIVSEIISQFRSNYDNIDYLKFDLYNGMDELLEKLSELKKNLYIITNKPEIPTTKILEQVKLKKFFKEILSINSIPDQIIKKKEMIKYLLNKNAMKNERTVYCGDTIEDYISSKENNIDFIYCEYGYGISKGQDILAVKANNPHSIFQLI